MKITNIRSVPITKLAISPFNVRQVRPTAEDDAELKASILANGVGQNLIVHSKRAKGRETFLVAAGGRRLRALEVLLAEGAITDAFEVPVRVVSEKEAREISLVENVQRTAMHPADEFAAFARIVEGGATLEEVAIRFGTTPLHVERRMKLGRLHPDLLAVYREGGMTLETCKALTLTDDHERQMDAWNGTESERRYGGGVQHLIRRLLTGEGVRSTSRIGRCVDPALYEAAGGTVERDLFAGHASETVELTFADEALAHRLATEALEAVAEPLRTEWKWVEVALEPEAHRPGWSRLSPVPIDPLATLTDELATVDARMVVLEDLDEDDWTDEASEEMDALYERRGALHLELEKSKGFTAEQKGASGCLVGCGSDGAHVACGILSPSDIQAIEAANREAAETAAAAVADERDTDGEDDGSQKDEDGCDGSVIPIPVGAPIVIPGQPAGIAATARAIEKEDVEADDERKDAPIHSQSLDLDLRQSRRQVLAAHVAGDFGTAFDMVLWQMANGILSVRYVHGAPLECSFRPEPDAAGSAKLDDTAAAALLAAHREGLRLDWMGKDPSESFAALCALPDEDKQALFAFCVSTMIVRTSTPVIEAVGSRLGVRVERFWRPTAETYWGRVKKDVSIGAARECIDAEWAAAHKDQKKGVLAQSMERVFAEGRGVGLTDEQIAAAKAWLPAGMGFAVSDEGADREAANDGGDASPDGAEVIEVPAFLRGAA